MPEGPECRRIAESLAQFTSNKKIVGIEILSGRYSKKIPSGFELIKENLPIWIAGAGVHGKFVYLILNKEFSIWNTLGMTGAWSTTEHKHNRIKLALDTGENLYSGRKPEPLFFVFQPSISASFFKGFWLALIHFRMIFDGFQDCLR